MCGISGFLKNQDIDERKSLETLERMNNSLRHRGPNKIGHAGG